MKRGYFGDLENWRYGALILLAGYALGLFSWQLAHRPLLPAYVFENQLTAAQRLDLLAWLVAGMAGAMIAWLALSAVLARTGRRQSAPLQPSAMAFWLTSTARLSIGLYLLPFLPALAMPSIETEAPVLVFCMVIAMSALAGGAVQAALAVRTQLRGGSAAAQPSGVSAIKDGETSLAVSQAGQADQVPEATGVHVAKLWPGLALVLALGAGYAFFMSLLSVSRHNVFDTHAFDLGIFTQGLSTILQHGFPISTQHGPQVVNHFGVHFAPIFYLLAPIYLPFDDARTLLVIQSLVLAAGVIPVYLLAREKLASGLLAVAVGACYLLYPALQGVNTFDFHEIALATPLLLFSIYFLESGRDRLFALFLALALLTKEEVALTGIALGLYAVLVKHRPVVGWLAALGSAIYFLVVTLWIMPALGGGPNVVRFEGVVAEGWSGFTGVLITLVTNPFYTFSYALLDPDKLLFLVLLLLPVLFTPLLAVDGWIVALPGLATLLLSSYEPQYQLGTQYPAIVVPAIFLLTVLGLARFLRGNRHPALASSLAMALLVSSLAMNYTFGWLLGKQFTGFPRPTQRDQVVASFLRDIPAQASVSTLSDYVPHLANREAIYLFPTVAGADYLLFDADLDANYWPLISRDPRGEAIANLAPYVTGGDYGLLREQDGVLLLKRGHDPSRNEAAIRALMSTTYDAADLPGAPSTTVLSDPEARSGQARISATAGGSEDAPPGLVFGPYATLLPGRYRVEFRLKLLDEGLVGPVATVDVFSYAAGGLLAQRDLDGSDFAASGPYQAFPLEFQTGQLLPDVEFRVGHRGPGALAADTISVTYLGPPGP